jgi:hypothetical protein
VAELRLPAADFVDQQVRVAARHAAR